MTEFLGISLGDWVPKKWILCDQNRYWLSLGLVCDSLSDRTWQGLKLWTRCHPETQIHFIIILAAWYSCLILINTADHWICLFDPLLNQWGSARRDQSHGWPQEFMEFLSIWVEVLNPWPFRCLSRCLCQHFHKSSDWECTCSPPVLRRGWWVDCYVCHQNTSFQISLLIALFNGLFFWLKQTTINFCLSAGALKLAFYTTSWLKVYLTPWWSLIKFLRLTGCMESFIRIWSPNHTISSWISWFNTECRNQKISFTSFETLLTESFPTELSGVGTSYKD